MLVLEWLLPTYAYLKLNLVGFRLFTKRYVVHRMDNPPCSR